MDIEIFRDHCLAKPGVTEETPFGPDTLVMKVCGKMFALCGFEFNSLNVKCDPELALELRERYPEVKPGFHMNKKHWNTVSVKGNIPDPLLIEWIDQSYELVVGSLPVKLRDQLRDLE